VGRKLEAKMKMKMATSRGISSLRLDFNEHYIGPWYGYDSHIHDLLDKHLILIHLVRFSLTVWGRTIERYRPISPFDIT